MGHLFNVYGISSSSPDLFTNVQSDYYWSGTEFAPDTYLAWFFYDGFQFISSKDFSTYAWAVRDGDVVACGAPEPPPPGSWQQSCDTGTADWHESSDGAWCATCDWACWMGICLPWDSCVDVNQCPSGYLENNNGELQCSP
jgi:hypothetical protein